MPRALVIDDDLLDALGDRFLNIGQDFPGQTFEAWLAARMRDYNRFGYPRGDGDDLLFDSLWDIVHAFPPASFEDHVLHKAEELRRQGGTFVKAARDLTSLATLCIELGT
jgi:hypothetical protein